MQVGHLRVGVIIFLLGSAVMTPALADVVYTDTTFNLADYLASPTYSSDPSASITYSSSANTLTITATFTATGGPFYTAQGLVNTTFTYDPLIQGGITFIDASVSEDFTVIEGQKTATGVSFTNGWRPTIEQDGVFYLADPNIPGPGLTCVPCTTGYNTLAEAELTATDFTAFDFTTNTFGTAHPNFAGDPMLLGISTLPHQTSSAPLSSTDPGLLIAQYQDLTFDIASVPEPASLVLLGTGLFGLAFLRRSKQPL